MAYEECSCDPLVKEGYHFVVWLGQLGICSWTPIEVTASVLGLLNILFWLFANVPQIVINFRTKSVEVLKAIHPLFLFCWLLGDITNLLGCIFTNQLPYQTYTAIYFCVMDAVLVGQYVYYACRRKSWSAKMEEVPLVEREEKYFVLYLCFALVLSSLFTIPPYSTENSPEKFRTRLLLSNSTLPCQLTIPLKEWEHILGIITAWVSAVLYVGSRIPQVIRNFQRKTTSGLSIGMFSMTIGANIFYGISMIMTLSLSPIGYKFWTADLAYLIGSIGPIIPSAIVVYQWLHYDKPWKATPTPTATPKE